MSQQTKAAKKEGQDDGFSVTSTSEEKDDVDDLFSLVRILAERQIDGTTMYLVEWKDYPLSKAMWEPPENLAREILFEWEDFKRQSGRRTARGFTIGDWKMAMRDEIAQKRARHEARNAKRASRGRQPTPFQHSGAKLLEIIEKSLEDFNEPDDENSARQIARPFCGAGARNPSKEPTHSDSPLLPETIIATGNEPDPVPAAQGQSRPQSPISPAPRPFSSADRKSPAAHTLPMNLPRRPKAAGERHISPHLPTASTRQQESRVLPRAATSARSKQPTPVCKDPCAGTNVFAGGKIRKDRATILDAVSDTSKEPKMLKLRHQNIVQKRLRDREGIVAPAFPLNRLVALGSSSATNLGHSNPPADPGPDTSTLSNDGDGDGDGVLGGKPSHLKTATNLAPNSGPAGEVPSRPSAELLDPGKDQKRENTKKRKRSVRWDDTITVVEVPRTRDEDATSRPPLAAPEAGLSRNYSEGVPTQSISMPCQLGTAQSDLIVLTFSSLSESPSFPWLQNFSNQSRIIFTHKYSTHDLKTQIELQEQCLCRGIISNADEERLIKIAHRLRSGCLGLLCHNGEYCVLIFPAEGGAKHGELIQDGGVLGLWYSIIKPSVFLEPSMLAPLTCGDSCVGFEKNSKHDVPVFDVFFEFQYDQLLPLSRRRQSGHKFFLAFPPSARLEVCLVAQWLRYFDEDCDIKSSLHQGSWASFLKVDQGTLILHEDVIWAVRHFPHLANLLRAPSGDFSFFLIKRTEPLLDGSLLQDSLRLDIGGSKQLFPIFRPGTAYLVTPSFLLSQPKQAYVFVKWFWQNYSRNSPIYRRGKLVVFSDIEDWTLNLARGASRIGSGGGGSDEEMQHHGWSPGSAENIIKTWVLLRNLIADSTDGTDGSIVFAPEVIHSCDEQSLVNWFGWWAVANMAEFRKFAVIGSGSQQPSRLTLCIQLPRYDEATIVALPVTPLKQSDAAVRRSQAAPWQLVYNDSGPTLADFLSQVDEAIRSEEFRPLFLFKFAISYWDPDMFFQMQDYRSAFKSFKEWLGHFPELVNHDGNPRGPRGNLNSYAGFFYTIEGAWDRASPLQGVKPTRRPWVAILRPTNPHRRPWSTAELFIWDCQAWALHSRKSAVHLSDLICAQRELVKLIREESQTTFELPLQRVWLGGSTADYDGKRLSEPLEIVLTWVASLPGNIKDLVPAPESKIPERNWKVVHPGQAQDMTTIAMMAPDPMHVNPPGLKSMVFSPPRTEEEVRRAECRNRLYDWTGMKRKQGLSASKAAFIFEPTMKWYTEQVQKGQGLHHLDIAPWNMTFSRHKIPDPKEVSDQW